MAETYTDGPEKPTIEKDPNAILDYPFDLTEYLDEIGDTLDTAMFILETPLVQVSSSKTAKIAIVVVSGGITGKTHRVTCRFTTVGGRQDDRSIFLKIKEK